MRHNTNGIGEGNTKEIADATRNCCRFTDYVEGGKATRETKNVSSDSLFGSRDNRCTEINPTCEGLNKDLHVG